jgi:hypothetical protein
VSACNVFYVLAVIAVVWGVVSAMAMTSFVSARGVKIKWVLIKLFIIKYASRYEEITRKETGKAGPWFYSYVISMNAAAGLAIVGIILSKI